MILTTQHLSTRMRSSSAYIDTCETAAKRSRSEHIEESYFPNSERQRLRTPSAAYITTQATPWLSRSLHIHRLNVNRKQRDTLEKVDNETDQQRIRWLQHHRRGSEESIDVDVRRKRPERHFDTLPPNS